MAGRPPPTKSRLPLFLGLTVAGAAGYYLYTAGGNPKVAEKQFEHDAARASSAVKNEIPGRGKEAKKEGEVYAKKAGAKFDNAVDEARDKLNSAESKFSQYGKDAGKDLQKKIDEADRKVEEASAKAKSGISSWFGGK